MKKQAILILALVLTSLLASSQSVKWSADDIKALTPDWTGERTADGRPKVSDNLLERLKKLSMEEVWGYLSTKGYENQFENFASTFENGWLIIHPEEVMTGRVVTAQFMPLRKDFDNYVQAVGKKENFWTIGNDYAYFKNFLKIDIDLLQSILMLHLSLHIL